MMIRPVETLQNDFKSIADYCKEFNKPVFLTENGEGAFVLMSLASYEAKREMFDLTVKLFEAELQFTDGSPTYTTEEVTQILEDAINGTAEAAA